MVPVLHHDPFINIDDKKNYLKDINYTDLLKIKPDLLRLDSIVELISSRSIGINFDIKELRSVKSVLGLLKEKNITENIIFSGCGINEARIIHSFKPGSSGSSECRSCSGKS